jgi:hypothetical protein
LQGGVVAEGKGIQIAGGGRRGIEQEG